MHEENIERDLKEKGPWDANWTHLAQKRPRQRTMEHCNKSPVLISGLEFFDKLSNYQLLKKDSVLWT
jgi:hypothetical protein